MRKTLLTAIAAICLNTIVAQDFESLLRAGVSDGSQYLEEYMEPAVISFRNGLAGGWMNTAKNHKLFGVDLTLSVNLAGIPDKVRNFTFDVNNYEAFQLRSGSTGSLPTCGGVETDEIFFVEAGTEIDLGGGQFYTYDQDFEFSVIRGVGADIPFNAAPTPTFQIGFGLMKNTDLKIRYIPTIEKGNFKGDLFGIGVMHDIKQWIPGLKLIPIDLVAFFGTTKLTSSVTIKDVNDDDFSISDASMELSVTASTLQVMLSKKLSEFTPYVGVGHNFTKSSINVRGEYTFKDSNEIKPDQTIVDPISLNFDGGNSPRVTVGAQLKLLRLTFHADYTIQEYNTFTAGIGVSVR